MTIVIAKKFGRRVVLASDTMISDASTGRGDAIPGRLKAICLSPTVSVAYAGHSDPAVHAIRAARRTLLATGSVHAAADVLVDASGDTAFDADFIFAFHEAGVPYLHKIRAGAMTDDLTDCFVGDPMMVAALHQTRATLGTEMPELGVLAGEGTFWNAFTQLFMTRGIALADGVGGVAIGLIASPFGHHYIRQAVSMAWDTIDLGRGITDAQHRAQRSGETAWIVETIPASLRGVAVVGLGFPQAGVAFLHSPLTTDVVERIDLGPPTGAGFINSSSLQIAIQNRANELANLLGGGVVELEGDDAWLGPL